MPYHTPTKKRNTRDIILGRRGNIDPGPAQQAAKKAKTPPTQNQPPPQPVSKYTIKTSEIRVELFPTQKPNRRLTPKEYEEEVADAIIWKRVPRTHLYDKPTYPWVPQCSPFTVNFDLNAPQ